MKLFSVTLQEHGQRAKHLEGDVPWRTVRHGPPCRLVAAPPPEIHHENLVRYRVCREQTRGLLLPGTVPSSIFPCVCVCVCVCLSVCLSVCLCVSVCLYEVNKQKDFYYSRRGWFLPLRFLSFCPSHPLYISIFPFLLFKKERICFFFCIDVSAGFLRQCPNSTRLLELFSRNM